MAKFVGTLQVEEVSETVESGRGLWKLLSPFSFVSDVAVPGEHVEILAPAGFVTDFASVPRILIAFWLVGDTAHEPAVIHDYLYTTGYFSKETADNVLYEAMKVANIPAWRAWMIYQGVNWGGSIAWNEHRSQTSITRHGIV